MRGGALVPLSLLGISFPEPEEREYLGLFNPAQAGPRCRDRPGLFCPEYGTSVQRVTDPRVGPAISWNRFYPHFELCLRRPQTRELVLVTSETSV